MKLFGKEPQERAISALIHDTNSAIGGVRNQRSFLQNWIRDNSEVDTTKLMEIANRLEKHSQELMKVLDTYLEKFKNDFK